MNEPLLEHITEPDGRLLAIIVRSGLRMQGTHFFTPGDFAQQLGYLGLPAGQRIEPHRHNTSSREVVKTQEALFIRSGVLRVDIYTTDNDYLLSRTLYAMDTILLVDGGHGFEVLEELEMLEVKQGPYLGVNDKQAISGVAMTSSTKSGQT
jgi:hypothetical protein